MFILPMGTFSILSTLFVAGHFIWGLLTRIPDQIIRYQALGFNLPSFRLPHVSFDLFFLNTGVSSVITMFALLLSLTLLFLSLQLSNGGKFRLGKDVFYYLTIYAFIVPFWLAKATYATVRRKDIVWR